MALKIVVHSGNVKLSDATERNLNHQFTMLERRLTRYPEAEAELRITEFPERRETQADLRLGLGPNGQLLISKLRATTVEHAVRLALYEIERQLERHNAHVRNEDAYGVPSRREPANTRPHPRTAEAKVEKAEAE